MARQVPPNGLIMQAWGGTMPGQGALITDSSTGDPAIATTPAGYGVAVVAFAVTLPVGGTTAVDQVTAYTPGFKFKLLSIAYLEAVATTGTNSTRPYNLEIGTTDVTGGVVTITTASAAVGRIIAGTAITALNTGTSTDTISIEVAASGTTHDAGSGAFLVRIQNMDTADAFATQLAFLKAAGYMASV